MSIALLDTPVTFDNGELGTLTCTRASTTTTAGTNTLGVVTVKTYNPAATHVVSTVTKGADNYTRGPHVVRHGIDWNCTEIWYKLGPTAESSTVTVTMDVSVTGIACTYSTFSGAQQSGQPDASATESGAGDTSPELIDITTVAANALIIECFTSDHVAGTVVAGQTSMGNESSYKIISGAGATYQVGWTSGLGDSYVHSAISFAPQPAPINLANPAFMVF